MANLALTQLNKDRYLWDTIGIPHIKISQMKTENLYIHKMVSLAFIKGFFETNIKAMVPSSYKNTELCLCKLIWLDWVQLDSKYDINMGLLSIRTIVLTLILIKHFLWDLLILSIFIQMSLPAEMVKIFIYSLVSVLFFHLPICNCRTLMNISQLSMSSPGLLPRVIATLIC